MDLTVHRDPRSVNRLYGENKAVVTVRGFDSGSGFSTALARLAEQKGLEAGEYLSTRLYADGSSRLDAFTVVWDYSSGLTRRRIVVGGWLERAVAP